MSTYFYRTDAVHASVEADSAEQALAKIIADGEWAATDSQREQRDIADGAWLKIFDTDGVAVLRRGASK